MPKCEADFKHDCDSDGFSNSIEHNGQWYCKESYFIWLEAKKQKRALDEALMQIAISQPDKLQKAQQTVVAILGGSK